MFHTKYSEIIGGGRFLSQLNEQADSDIKTRGNSIRAQVPPELADNDWFLSISDIAYSYCPTDRYLYLSKIRKIRPSLSWASYQGKIMDELIPHIYHTIYEYSCSLEKVSDWDSVINVKADLYSFIDEKKEEFTSGGMIDAPRSTVKRNFFKNIKKLVDYELLLANSIMFFRISNIYDMNIKSEFNMLLPYDFKLKMSAPELGLSGSSEIDFIMKKSILGEIKSGEWHSFYGVGLAGYAMAYEYDRKEKANLGVIICPTFLNKYKMPIFNNTANITIINESWRKIFISNRNRRIDLVRTGEDPGKPESKEFCRTCGYYTECWSE